MKKIHHYYWKLIGWRLYRFKISIINLIKWFPVIWKDRNWDDWFIWEILKFKLTNQANYISRKDRHTVAQYDAQKMRLCVRLIEKVQDEYYAMEYMDYFEDKFRFVPCEDKPGYSKLEIDEISNTFEEYVIKYYSTYRKIIRSNNCADSKCIAMKMGQYNHEKAKRILFKLLSTHIERWWD